MQTPTATPELIHGFPIENATAYYSSPGLKDSRIILVKRGENDYVTAYHCRGETSWGWGHYFDDISAAFDDYLSRVVEHKRNKTEMGSRWS